MTKPLKSEQKEEPLTEAEDGASESDSSDAEDPTRYGDWVKNGRCIDF